jgi:hypothetical protein
MMKLNLMFLVFVTVSYSMQVFADVPEKKIRKIHNRILTVDTHCDTPMNMLEDNFDVGIRNKPPQSRVDFPRMKKVAWMLCFLQLLQANANEPRKYRKCIQNGLPND